jgi:hypothetical protein
MQPACRPAPPWAQRRRPPVGDEHRASGPADHLTRDRSAEILSGVGQGAMVLYPGDRISDGRRLVRGGP